MQPIIDSVKSAALYKAEWDASPDIREEFGGNFEPYAAYRLAEDRGLIGGSTHAKRRLSVLQVVEKINLEWQLTPTLRERFSSFDSFRKHRWQELNGR